MLFLHFIDYENAVRSFDTAISINSNAKSLEDEGSFLRRLYHAFKVDVAFGVAASLSQGKDRAKGAFLRERITIILV